jgi:RNA polymerase sigma-70 factor (sigma-E family)
VTLPDDDFSAFVEARWSHLVVFARYLGCAPGEDEDLVQTALIRCYRSWSKVRRADRVDAFVHRTMVRVHAKSRRRRWHGEIPSAALPEHADGGTDIATEARADLRRLLSGLTEEHRAVLVLRYVMDQSERQTADILGIPVGTVKSRVSRALASIDTAEIREETT